MRNLLSTCALSSIFTFGCVTMTQAAIVYTDIADVTLASGDSISIDFNNDGTKEFSIVDNSFGTTPLPYTTFNGPNFGFVMVGNQTAGGWDAIKGIDLNTPINSTSNFANNGADGYIDPDWSPSTFTSNQDTYIGAQFELNGAIHFGWIRVHWNAAGTFIVKGYAYEDQVNTEIPAGAEGNSTANIDKNIISLRMYPNPSSEQLHVELSSEGSITIFNMQGQALVDSEKRKQHVFSVINWKDGFYLVRLEQPDGTVSTQRFLKL